MIGTQYAQLAKKLPSSLYKAAAQLWIDKEYPRHLFIETTSACNLTCSYCPRERRGESIQFDMFKRIIDEAREHGPRSFSLHLFGEPLLYKRIMDAIAYIKQSNPRNTILLTTNGTYLESAAKDSRLFEVSQILWSWREEAKFSEVLKDKLREWGKFRVRFIKEVTPPEAREEWASWPNVEERSLHNYGGNINLSDMSSVSVENPTVSQTRHPCYHLWLAPAVAWNGDILLCCSDPHRKEVLGRFPEVSVGEAWRGDRLANIRLSHLRGEYGGICSGCDVWRQYPDIFFKWQKR